MFSMKMSKAAVQKSFENMTSDEKVNFLQERLQRARVRLNKRHKAAKHLARAAEKNGESLGKYQDLVTLLVRETISSVSDPEVAMRIGYLVGMFAPNHYKNRDR